MAIKYVIAHPSQKFLLHIPHLGDFSMTKGQFGCLELSDEAVGDLIRVLASTYGVILDHPYPNDTLPCKQQKNVIAHCTQKFFHILVTLP